MGRAAAALGVALALLGCGGEAARIDAGPDPRPDAAPEVAPDAATATPSDAAIPPDAAPEPELDAGRPPAASRCTDIDGVVDCEYETLTLLTGLSGLVPRDVHYQVPTTAPPPGGYPVVLVFQGSLFTGELSWYGWEGAPFGALHQARTVKTLLDRGYAVLTPEAHANGSTYWDTNVPPYSASWELAPDHRFMLDIFEAIEGGRFGALSPERWYATGISSGGYMTSRMAVAYPGRFRALAICSASYATCSGPLCVVPDLPADHPPTLFLHGAADAVVPISTMRPYAAALRPLVPVDVVVDDEAGHAWIPAAPDAVAGWFDAHR